MNWQPLSHKVRDYVLNKVFTNELSTSVAQRSWLRLEQGIHKWIGNLCRTTFAIMSLTRYSQMSCQPLSRNVRDYVLNKVYTNELATSVAQRSGLRLKQGIHKWVVNLCRAMSATTSLIRYSQMSCQPLSHNVCDYVLNKVFTNELSTSVAQRPRLRP